MHGVLAHAKNSVKLFWEEKFHATNGKAQACTQGGLLSFPFKFCRGGGKGKEFFSFFPGSQCVPIMLPMGSHHVLTTQVPNVFINMSSIAPHFYPICFGKCCPSFTYIAGPKGRISILQNRTFYFGEPPIKYANHKSKKKLFLILKIKSLGLPTTTKLLQSQYITIYTP